jgi:hypothetical protein
MSDIIYVKSGPNFCNKIVYIYMYIFLGHLLFSGGFPPKNGCFESLAKEVRENKMIGPRFIASRHLKHNIRRNQNVLLSSMRALMQRTSSNQPPGHVVQCWKNVRSFCQSTSWQHPSRILEDLDQHKESAGPKRQKFVRQLERAVQPARTVGEAVAQLGGPETGLLYADLAGSGLVAVNKPYGLPVHPAQDSPLSLDSCLPGLAAYLGVGKKCCLLAVLRIRHVLSRIRPLLQSGSGG